MMVRLVYGFGPKCSETLEPKWLRMIMMMMMMMMPLPLPQPHIDIRPFGRLEIRFIDSDVRRIGLIEK